MNLRIMVLMTTLCAGTLNFQGVAADALWTQDFAAAKAQAAKEGKDLLVDFTGSDWCGWCIRLKDEVFKHDAFKKAAPEKFVLVELDFPKSIQQDEKIKAQNQKLQQEYAIQGFPTILLMDAEGKPYAKTGYQKGGPDEYLKHLEELRGQKATRNDLIAKAHKAEGVEKAKLLDGYIKHMAQSGIEGGWEKEVEQIKKLDADNKAGLKQKYECIDAFTAITNKLNETKDVDQALKDVDKFLVEMKPSPVMQQQAYMFKAEVYIRGKQDQKGGVESLKKALAADPDSEMGKRLPEIIKRFEAPPPPAEGSGK